MLLVSGFKPIQTNYNNQNVSKANFSQPQFHTKADSVSFTSNPTSKMHALVQATFVENQGLFGKGFKNYMAAVKAFLAREKLSIDYKTAATSIRINPNNRVKDVFFNIENGIGARLMNDEWREPIHELWTTTEINKNVASVEILDRFFGKSLLLESSESRRYDVELSKDDQAIYAKTQAMRKALEKFNQAWVEINYGSDSAKKVQDYQDALKKLMPEE